MAETTRALEFLEPEGDTANRMGLDGLKDFCHVLFTLNEFVYVD